MQLGQGNWFDRLAVPTVRCATVPTMAAAGVVWASGASLAVADHDAGTTPMLRAVWIDDLPAEASPSPSPFANGQVSLFPGQWASLGDPGMRESNLRFRLASGGKIYGTMGDLKSWSDQCPAPDHGRLCAVRWSLTLGAACGQPQGTREVLTLADEPGQWTVLTDINDDGWICGATMPSLPDEVGPARADLELSKAGAWDPTLYRRAVSGPPGSWALAVGDGSLPIVAGRLSMECTTWQDVILKFPGAAATVAATAASLPAQLAPVPMQGCGDDLFRHSAIEAIVGGTAAYAAGWSVCRTCDAALFSLCNDGSAVDYLAVAEWPDTSSPERLWHAADSLGQRAPLARMIAASGSVLGGSIVSRYEDDSESNEYECGWEHAAVFDRSGALFTDLHTRLPGSVIYGQARPDHGEEIDPHLGVELRQSRIASVRDLVPLGGNATGDVLAVGARFGLYPRVLDPELERGEQSSVACLWRSRSQPNGATEWCSAYASDLVCNAPPASIVVEDAEYQVALEIRALHDIGPTAALVGVGALRVERESPDLPDPTTILVPGWGTAGPKLVFLTLIADITLDTLVDGADLGVVLSGWGMSGAAWTAGDLDGDGMTSGADLGLILTMWTDTGAAPGQALQIGNCGEAITVGAAENAVQLLGFEDLEQFGAVGALIGTDAFAPLASEAAALAARGEL